MIEFLKKVFTKRMLVIVLAGLSVFGFFRYSEYRFNLIESHFAQVENSQNVLEKKVKDLENSVQGTESNVASIQAKSTDLSNQVSGVNNTVQVLKKLSTTDPELLKKYSKVYFLNEHYVPISLTDIDLSYRSIKSIN